MKPWHSTCMALALCAAGAAMGGPIVYTPVNPTFGGSPLNGSYLLGRAQAQDRHKDPNAPSATFGSTQNQLEQFQNSLQQAILSRISAAVSSSVVGSDGKLVPGTVETQNFRITISDLGGGRLQILTVDKNTNATASFEIMQ